LTTQTEGPHPALVATDLNHELFRCNLVSISGF